MFSTQVLQIQLQRTNPNTLQHKGNVWKKSTARKKRQLVRTEHALKNSSCFLTDSALDFHLNNQKLGCMWFFFFFNLVPSVHLLPKISFAWPKCLSAKDYLCCFCACLLRLTWHLASYAWKSHTEKFCVILFLWKAVMPRVPAITALRTK